MKPRQLVVFSVLVGLPLALLVWFGVRLARNEQAVLRDRFRSIALQQLQETESFIAGFLQRRGRELLRITDFGSIEPESLRELTRRQSLIRQVFVLSGEGLLVYPNPTDALNRNERGFVARTEQLIADRDLVRAAMSTGSDTLADALRQASAPNHRDVESSLQTPESRKPAANAADFGWHVWYWGRGLNLIFWRRLADGQLACVELDRARWLADLIGELPSSSLSAESKSSNTARLIRLLDSGGKPLYQWGTWAPSGDQQPLGELPLRAPLSAWRLTYYLRDENVASGSLRFNIYTALGVAGLTLMGLATYFYREHSRDVREARQRVVFVNQVSHELKTPLTNIRMYADLMETDLATFDEADAAPARRRLEVIRDECLRLSRLIGNVLTFAKQNRGELQIRLRPARVHETVERVIRQFAPSMTEKGIRVTRVGSTPVVQVDVDVVEQIVGNLFSNVEKYAGSGSELRVSVATTGDRTAIHVTDDGPGIPRDQRERVFQSFYCGSRRIDETVGTGIGLAIARDLARRHGGDVRLEEAERRPFPSRLTHATAATRSLDGILNPSKTTERGTAAAPFYDGVAGGE